MIKLSTLFLVQKHVKHSTNLSQLIFLAISSLQLKAVKNLGVWFDSEFPFLRHVQNICKSCFAQIRDLKCLGGHLTCHAALMAANALVGSRLDYCN